MSHIVSTTMKSLHCAYCGILFSVTSQFMQDRRDDHGNFYCPSKHSNYYPGENEVDKLKKKAARAEEQFKRMKIERDFNERSRRAYKGKLNHIKKAISTGECPCCGSVFKNLRRHMIRKHPEYKIEA